MTAYFLHLANSLLLFSFLVRDIFFLRLISIVASILFSIYFYVQDPPMWAALAWNIVFILVNIYQISKLLLERRKIPLGADELILQKKLFPLLTSRDIRELYTLASRKSVSSGNTVHLTTPKSNVFFIVHGDGQRGHGRVSVGDLFGVQGYVSGANCETTVTVNAESELVYLCWTHEQLRRWSERSPECRGQLMQVFSRSLVAELQDRTQASG